MRTRLLAALGLGRSIVVYYAMPWRRRGLSRLYAGLVSPGDLVFDIGAHVGNRSRTLHALGARVVAVEPQPLFAAFLRRALPRDRAVLVEKAVGREPGTARLRISRRHPTVSTLSAEWIEQVARTGAFSGVAWDGEADVEVTTLDSLAGEFGTPDFCKIDVEGLEAEILAGLSRPLPLIAFEFLPESPDVAEACVERLEVLGTYRFNFVAGEGASFRLPEWTDGAEILAAAARAKVCGDIYARLDTPRS